MIKGNVTDKGIRRALRRMERAAGPEGLEAPLKAMGRSVKTQINLGFRSGKDPYGNAWTPLKSREGQPLRKSGRLQRSIGSKIVGGRKVQVGTNLKYAKLHQFGGTVKAKNHPYLRFKIGGEWVSVKKVKIPARPYLPLKGIPEAWVKKILSLLKRHMNKAIKGA